MLPSCISNTKLGAVGFSVEPNQIFPPGLAACILVLRQRKAQARAGKVLTVDASTLFRKGRAQNFLEPEHAAEILLWYQKFTDIEERPCAGGFLGGNRKRRMDNSP